LFLEADINPDQIQSTVISSVVPDLTDIIYTVADTLFPAKPILVGVSIYQKLPIKVMNPYQIGSDLVANAVAAYVRYRNACVVIDFGTALTYTVVNNDGEIVGVAIAPGLRTALKSLSQHAAKLFDVPLQMPASVLGKGTVHAIQAGILISTEGAVKHMVGRIEQELGVPIRKIATGGLCSVIPELTTIVDEIDPNLTLQGLLEIGRISR
jgi:type III pantothenate kinase